MSPSGPIVNPIIRKASITLIHPMLSYLSRKKESMVIVMIPRMFAHLQIMLNLPQLPLPPSSIKKPNHSSPPPQKKSKSGPTQTRKKNEVGPNKPNKKCTNRCAFTPQTYKKTSNKTRANPFSTPNPNKTSNFNRTNISNN